MSKWKIALDNYIEATNTHNFNNVKEHLSDKAIYYFSDQTCVTLGEIQTYFENAWDTIKNEVYNIKNVKWKITENMAYCLYDYEYQGYYNEKFVQGGGRATNIFVLENEDIKLIHEHLSAKI